MLTLDWFVNSFETLNIPAILENKKKITKSKEKNIKLFQKNYQKSQPPVMNTILVFNELLLRRQCV